MLRFAINKDKAGVFSYHIWEDNWDKLIQPYELSLVEGVGKDPLGHIESVACKRFLEGVQHLFVPV